MNKAYRFCNNGNAYLDSEELRDLRDFQKEMNLSPLNGGKDNRAGTRLEDGILVLYSFWTAIACQTPDGKFHRLWNDWSATAINHVSAFGWNIGKKDWMNTPVESLYQIKKAQQQMRAKQCLTA